MMFAELRKCYKHIRLIHQTRSSLEETTCVFPEAIPEMKKKKMIILTNVQQQQQQKHNNLMGYFKTVAY